MSKLGNALIRKYGIMQTTNIKDFNTGPDQTSSNENFKLALANVKRLKTSQTTKILAQAPENQFRSESKSEFEQTPKQLNSMFKSYDHKDGIMSTILKMQGIYEKYPPENR
jgi:predicted methyltransferase